MIESFELSIEVSEQYEFKPEALDRIAQNPWVKNQWPLVYFIRNDKTKIAYVGESTDGLFIPHRRLQTFPSGSALAA